MDREDFARTMIDFVEDLEGVENEVVNLYPDRCFETFEGFGGAITDAAGYVYSLMGEEDKKKLIETYFTENEMDYRIVRIHMDSCDFSTEMCHSFFAASKSGRISSTALSKSGMYWELAMNPVCSSS